MFTRTHARTIRNNVREPHMKMWGFETKRARLFTRTSPRRLPWNFITILSAPPKKSGTNILDDLKKKQKKTDKGQEPKKLARPDRDSSKSASMWGSEMAKRSISAGFAFQTLLAFGWVSQRRRNDDKNNFWEVESKGGVGRGFEKRVDRGPTLKFFCRAKAQEKQHFENRIFIVVAFSQEMQWQ